MREIKFRAWDEESKVMYPVIRMEWWVTKDGERRGISALVGTSEETEFEGELELIQFTGLLDKNGIEIYEGDIAESKGHRLIFTIEYRLSMGGFMACSEGLLMGLGQHADILEVLGNLYENPELLEER